MPIIEQVVRCFRRDLPCGKEISPFLISLMMFSDLRRIKKHSARNFNEAGAIQLRKFL